MSFRRKLQNRPGCDWAGNRWLISGMGWKTVLVWPRKCLQVVHFVSKLTLVHVDFKKADMEHLGDWITHYLLICFSSMPTSRKPPPCSIAGSPNPRLRHHANQGKNHHRNAEHYSIVLSPGRSAPVGLYPRQYSELTSAKPVVWISIGSWPERKMPHVAFFDLLLRFAWHFERV